jgi:cytochrome c556
MQRLGIVIALLGCGLAAAIAADPIAERQQLMKDNGKAAKAAGEMVQGKTPYDAAAAKAAMNSIAASAKILPTLFPAGSETGHETEASPKIWQNKAGFDAVAAKLARDAAAAAAAAEGGLDAFKPAFGAAAANCKACHDDFRISKQ